MDCQKHKQTRRKIRRGSISYQGQIYLSSGLVPFEGYVAVFLIPVDLHPQVLFVQVGSHTVQIQRADELPQNIAKSAVLDRSLACKAQRMHSLKPLGT